MGCIVLLGIAGAVFAVLRGHSTSTPLPPSSPSAHTTSPAVTTRAPVNPVPAGPAATVQAYVAAINAHDYAKAWDLGGNNTGQTYTSFEQGFNGTARDALTILSVSGNVVTAQLAAGPASRMLSTSQSTRCRFCGPTAGSHDPPVRRRRSSHCRRVQACLATTMMRTTLEIACQRILERSSSQS